MPVHIGELTSEVTVADGELPLTPAQIEALVRLVLARVAQAEREKEYSREATSVRGSTSQRRSG